MTLIFRRKMMTINNKRRLLAIIIFLPFLLGIPAWIYSSQASSLVVSDASEDFDFFMEADSIFEVSRFSILVEGYIDGDAKFFLGGNEEIIVSGNFTFARDSSFSGSAQRKKGIHFRPKNGATGHFLVKWKFK